MRALLGLEAPVAYEHLSDTGANGEDRALLARVYRVLDAYFATQPATAPLNLERAPATPIPLHRGAARFYRQRELSR